MNSIKQKLAFDKLSKLKVGALFMEMGTGKTKVALDLINFKKNKVDFILWICPFSIKQEIKEEIKKWYPSLTDKIEIVGCETISSSPRIYLDLLSKVQLNKTFIVVDESLKIKNINAKRTKRILELGRYAMYKLILNGTPIAKNVLDLFTQMNFLSHKILNMTYIEFKNNYCEYYIRGKLKNKVKKQHNIDHLISLIQPYIYDCELDLGKNKSYLEFEYINENSDVYQSIKDKYRFCQDGVNFFAIATELQHCYCQSIKKQEIINNIINNSNEQFIVFVKFIDSIPKEAYSITGEKGDKERKEIINKFKNNKIKVLYITYGCGSFGLNLQNCKNVIFAEHTFDYSQRLQAEARIYRIGQENNVNYYDINCQSGLEQLIKMCIEKKIKLLDQIKKEIESKGEEEWLKSL